MCKGIDYWRLWRTSQRWDITFIKQNCLEKNQHSSQGMIYMDDKWQRVTDRGCVGESNPRPRSVFFPVYIPSCSGGLCCNFWHFWMQTHGSKILPSTKLQFELSFLPYWCFPEIQKTITLQRGEQLHGQVKHSLMEDLHREQAVLQISPANGTFTHHI